MRIPWGMIRIDRVRIRKQVLSVLTALESRRQLAILHEGFKEYKDVFYHHNNIVVKFRQSKQSRWSVLSTSQVHNPKSRHLPRGKFQFQDGQAGTSNHSPRFPGLTNGATMNRKRGSSYPTCLV